MPSLSARSTSALPCSRMSTHLWSPLAHRDSAVLPFSSCLQLCYLLTHRTAQTQKQAATRVGPGQPSRVLCLCGGAAFLGSARKSIRLDLQRKQQYMMRRHDCDLHVAVSSLFNEPLDELRLSIEGSKMKVGFSFIVCGVDALATANTVHSRHSTSFLTPCVYSPCCFRARAPTPPRHSKFRISSGEYSHSLFLDTDCCRPSACNQAGKGQKFQKKIVNLAFLMSFTRCVKPRCCFSTSSGHFFLRFPAIFRGAGRACSGPIASVRNFFFHLIIFLLTLFFGTPICLFATPEFVTSQSSHIGLLRLLGPNIWAREERKRSVRGWKHSACSPNFVRFNNPGPETEEKERPRDNLEMSSGARRCPPRAL